MKTLAAVLVKQKKPLEVWELEVPALQAGQLLVKIKVAGICRTQLNEIDGIHGKDAYLPHLLGHEAAGSVEAVGPGVEKAKVGERVVISWIKGSGQNAPGGVYDHKGQRVNSGSAAVFSQCAIVAENRVTPIPADVPADIAALFGCAVPTGVGVIQHALQVTPGSSVAIFGVGGVGASAILGAKLQGAHDIIAIDISPDKLKLAKKLGATNTINSATQALPTGIDFAVDATGVPQAMEQAFSVLNDHGVLAIAGHPKKGAKIKVDPFELIKGRRIIGTWGGNTQPDKDIPTYIEAWREKKLPLETLITHHFKLNQINKAIETLRSGHAGRVILEIGKK